MIGAIKHSVQENNLQYIQYDLNHDSTVANPTDRQPEFECVKHSIKCNKSCAAQNWRSKKKFRTSTSLKEWIK